MDGCCRRLITLYQVVKVGFICCSSVSMFLSLSLYFHMVNEYVLELLFVQCSQFNPVNEPSFLVQQLNK